MAKEVNEDDLLRALEPDAVLEELRQKLHETKGLESKVGIGEYNLKPLASFEGVSGYEEVERYWVKDPFVFIVILFNEKDNVYLYHVVEPALTPFERALLEKIYEDLKDILILEEIPTEAKKSEVLKEKTKKLVQGYKMPISPSSLDKILYYTERNYIGYGRIDPLMNDRLIEDVSCDGVDVPVFLYHRRYQNIKTNIVMGEDELDLFVTALAQRCGKHLSAGRPMVSATMPEGSRLQATLGREISTRGSSFSIRKFSENPFTPVELIKHRTFSVDMLAYLWMAIENNRSLIFAGGTAAGKTSSLNAVSLFIPPISKIISIEDTRELTLYHENWIASLTREPFILGEDSAIDMFDLLRQALRQRPEYIIVGEIRGAEALTLFQAMSTGHTTYSTMHAGSVQEVVSRLENEPINVPSVMLQALDIVSVQALLNVGEKRVRRTYIIVELTGMDPNTGDIRINVLFKWNPVEDKFERIGESQVLRDIMKQRGWTAEEMDEELENRRKVLEYLVEKDIRYYRDIARIIQMYYQNPDRVLKGIAEGVYI